MAPVVISPARAAFWRNRHVFVTGCTGLLGSWMSRALVDHGAYVVGLVRDSVPEALLHREGTAGRMTLVSGEIQDQALLERALGEYEIDAVFHLAAQTIVAIANRNPLSTFDSNIRGTWSLLEACRRSPTVTRVVAASSDKAYGCAETLPYTEDVPLRGEHPYDVSKSCADLLCHSYFMTYNLPVCATRCGNFYGGGDLNFNRIVPGTIRSVLFGERPVIRSDGSYIRDYFYVADAVDAYVHLAERMDDVRVRGEAFNFSNGLQITVIDLVRRILNLMGSALDPVVLNEARHEIRHQYLSSRKGAEILGWTCTSDLDENLRCTIAWYEAFFGRPARPVG